MENTNNVKLEPIKAVRSFKINPTHVIISILCAVLCFFSIKLINTNKMHMFLQKHQNEITHNQSLLITNLNQKNIELSVLLGSYDKKLNIMHTNLSQLQDITEKLKASSDEKGIKIKELSQEKSALESDLMSLRNTLFKMTKEIVELNDELKVAKTDKDQNDLFTKIESVTKERDFLKNKIKEYETTIDVLKKDNIILAQKLRNNFKTNGYEFKNKIGEWPKGGEVLMRMSSYHTNNLLKENSNVNEPTQDEKPKKVGLLKRIFSFILKK